MRALVGMTAVSMTRAVKGRAGNLVASCRWCRLAMQAEVNLDTAALGESGRAERALIGSLAGVRADVAHHVRALHELTLA